MITKIKNKKQKTNIITEVVKKDQKSIMKQIKKLLEKKQKLYIKICLKNRKN